MLLTLTTTHTPATDLGYLLHKHPDRAQTFPLNFGQAHVFYPEATSDRCTAALLLDLNPIQLIRGKSRNRTLAHYVNDRPYVASSFLSVAIAKVFRSALSGRCQDKPDLVNTSIPLTLHIPVLPCRGGAAFLRHLFEPLGYQLETRSHPLNDQILEGQDSIYLDVTLTHKLPLKEALSHLYVLIPVLDNEKHYWIEDEEVDKLLRHGEGWLGEHPARNTITRRYLKRMRGLTRIALDRLTEESPPEEKEIADEEEQLIEKPMSLNQQRLETVTAMLKAYQVQRIVDLGCGEGKLLRSLMKEKSFRQITGLDVSYRALEIAQERLHLDRLPIHQQDRINLIQGSLIYRDERIQGYDAATVIEVIEHLDLDRLAALERVLFEFTQPNLVIATTPNIEFNVRFETLPAGQLRHRDHRFEWTRQEFQDWANGVCDRFGYTVTFSGIGNEDIEVGTPTQMGVFQR